MIITATDFKNRTGKYIKLAEREDIIITRNGKHVVRLTRIKKNDTPLTDSLIGIMSHKKNIDLKKEREERLKKNEITD